MSVETIAAEIQARIDEARREGFREGWEAMRASILNAVPPAPNGDTATRLEAQEQEGDGGRGGIAPRAPRGLTNAVVRTLLWEHGLGMKIENLQRAAVARDARISPKTVYNEVYRDPQTFYRDTAGNWRLTDSAKEAMNAPEERERQAELIAQ